MTTETSRNSPMVLWVAILGSSIAFIDGTIGNVLIPTLKRELSANAVEAQWIIESYLLFLVCLLLLGGKLGDVYGRRRIYAQGLVVMLLGSILCGFAINVTMMLAGRAVQGVGAALLIPGSLALITAHFDEEKRSAAIGQWSAFSAITGAIGPFIAGLLIHYLSWRFVFFINLPLAAVTLYFLKRVPVLPTKQESLDLSGTVIITLGLALITFGFLQSTLWSLEDPRIIFCLVAGFLLLIVFVRFENTIKSPMVDMQLFSIRNFWVGNLYTLFLYAPMGAVMFFLAFVMQDLEGYTAVEYGLVFIPFVACLFLLSRPMGVWAYRYGPRFFLGFGAFLAGLGLTILAWAVEEKTGYWQSYFPAFLIMGIGFSFFVSPLTNMVMNAAGSERAGIASGINNAVSRGAAVLGLAVFGLVATQTMLNYASSQNEPDIAGIIYEQKHLWLDVVWPKEWGTEKQESANIILTSAFVHAYKWVCLLCAGLSFLGTICAIFLHPIRQEPDPNTQE